MKKSDMKVKDLGNENDTAVSLVYLFPLLRNPADVKSELYKSGLSEHVAE